MPRYKLTLEYAGTRYSGWQIQKNARTVQGELQRALQTVVGGPVETYGSGRTDAGVHAIGQVAHADFGRPMPPATLVTRVNDALPSDINVRAAEQVPARFHARHSAVARSYLYQISTRRSAFAKPYVWWVRADLDLDRMRDAARPLLGLGDFRSFTDDDPEEKSTRVLVSDVRIELHGDLILIRLIGSHFLWKMVRRLVGVLAAAGRGEVSRDQVTALLTGDGDERLSPAALTAPAAGLFLEHVTYTEAAWPPLAPAAVSVR
jgi:tRNA pseudouridine38-40 synthase